MDYITNYYKNLSEQLQTKVNALKKQKALYENINIPGSSNFQNLMTPEQPTSVVTGKITSPSQEFSKAPDNIRSEGYWYNKVINPFSGGDASDPAAFNSRYAYVMANWNNMTELQRQGILASMMAAAPGKMTGQQFLALFPQHIQSFLIANYNSIYQIYSDTWG
jgi:hypothetical protein